MKIYPTPVTVDEERCPQFTVAYYFGAKRVRQRFADFEEDGTEAQAEGSRRLPLIAGNH